MALSILQVVSEIRDWWFSTPTCETCGSVMQMVGDAWAEDYACPMCATAPVVSETRPAKPGLLARLRASLSEVEIDGKVYAIAPTEETTVIHHKGDVPGYGTAVTSDLAITEPPPLRYATR